MCDMQGPKLTLFNAEQFLLPSCTIPALFITFSSLEDALFCNWTNQHQGFGHLREKFGAWKAAVP